MAKNKNPDDLDLDLNDEDFNLDDELGGMDFGDPMAAPPPPKDSREAITRSAGDVASNFVGTFKDDKLKTATDIAKKSIPESLSKEADTVTDIHDSVKEEFYNAGIEIKKQGKSTLDAIQKVLPANNDKLNGVLAKLSDWLSDGNNTEDKGPSKEDLEREKINAELLAALGAREEATAVEMSVRQQIENNRATTQNEILLTTSANVERLRKFDYEITNSYYRKSLEIQYKSLFVNKELLEATKTGFDTFKNQFATIINNTGLPEVVKIKNSERLVEDMKSRAVTGFNDMLYSDANPLMAFKKRLKDKVEDYKDRTLEVLGETENMAAMIASGSEMGMSKSALLGMMLAETIKEKAGSALGKVAEKNDFLREKIYNAKLAMTDISGTLKEKATEHDGLIGTMMHELGDMFDANSKSKLLIEKKNMNDASIFDNRAHTSIVKIIPGLLSKIYAEMKTLRISTASNVNQSDVDAKELIYNTKNDRFEDKETIKKTIKQNVTHRLEQGTGKSIESLMSTIKQHGGLELDETDSKIVRKALIKYVVNPGFSSDPRKLMSNKFVQHLPDRLKQPFASSVKKTLVYGERNDLELGTSLGNTLSSMRDQAPGLQSELKELEAMGYGSIGEELGVTEFDKRNLSTSYNKKGYTNFIIGASDKMDDKYIREQYSKDKAKFDEAKKIKEENDKRSFKDKALGKNKVKAKKEEKDEWGDVITKSSSTGFSKGGYTGDGGKHEEAGVVHGKEYVLNDNKLETLLNAVATTNTSELTSVVKDIASEVSDKTKNTNLKAVSDKAVDEAKIIKDKIGVRLEDAKNSNTGMYLKDVLNDTKKAAEDKAKSLTAKVQGPSLPPEVEVTMRNAWGKAFSHRMSFEEFTTKFSAKYLAEAAGEKKEKPKFKSNADKLRSRLKVLKERYEKEVPSKVKKSKFDNNPMYQRLMASGDLAAGYYDDDTKAILVKHFMKQTTYKTFNEWMFAAGTKLARQHLAMSTDKNLQVASKVKRSAEKGLNKAKDFMSEKTEYVKQELGYYKNSMKENFNILKTKLLGGEDDEYKDIVFIGKYDDMDEDTKKALKLEFFSSPEYKSDQIKDFSKWLAVAKQIDPGSVKSRLTGALEKLKQKYSPLFKAKTKLDDLKKEATDEIMGKLTGTGLKELSLEAEEHMRQEFFKSEEFRTKMVTDFDIWLKAFNFRRNGTSLFSRLKKKMTIKNILATTRKWDKKIAHGARDGLLKVPGLAWDGLTGGIAAAGRGVANTGRGLVGLKKLTSSNDKDKTKGESSGIASSVAKGIGGGLFNAAGIGLKGLWNTGAAVTGAVAGAVTPEFMHNPIDKIPSRITRLKRSFLDPFAGRWTAASQEAAAKHDSKRLFPWQKTLDEKRDKVKENDKAKADNKKSLFGLGKSPAEKREEARLKAIKKKEDKKVRDTEIKSKKEAKAKAVADKKNSKKQVVGESLGDRTKRYKDTFSNMFKKKEDKPKVTKDKDGKPVAEKKETSLINPTTILLAIAAGMSALRITFTDVKEFLSGTWTAVKNVFNFLKPIATGIFDVLKTGFEWMKVGFGYLKNIPNFISNIGGNIIMGAKSVISSAPGLGWMAPSKEEIAENDAKNNGTHPSQQGSGGDSATSGSGSDTISGGKPSEEKKSTATTTGEMVGYGAAAYAAHKTGVLKLGIKAGGIAVDATKGAVNLGTKLAGKTPVAITTPTPEAPKSGGMFDKFKKWGSSAIDTVKKVGGNALDSAKKAGGNLVENVKKVGAKVLKGGGEIFDKVVSYAKQLKTKIAKRLTGEVGKRLIAKIASKLLPGVGLLLLANDVVSITKFIAQGYSFGSAVSKGILGFDIFNEKDPVLDENGNPVPAAKLAGELQNKGVASKENKELTKTVKGNTVDPKEEKGFFGKIGDSIANGVSNVGNALSNVKDNIMNSAAVQNTSNAISNVGNYISAGVGKARDLISSGIGAVAGLFESGGKKNGAGMVSSGKGDHGGVSYGTHQFSTKTVANYVANSRFKNNFKGLTPGTPEFGDKWKAIFKDYPDEFAEDQEAFIAKSHYQPQVTLLKKYGIDLPTRSKALQSTAYSIGVQYGGSRPIIPEGIKAAGLDPAAADDEKIIKATYAYKRKNVGVHFKSSSVDVQKGVAKRINDEEATVLKMLGSSPSPTVKPPAKTTTAVGTTAGSAIVASKKVTGTKSTSNTTDSKPKIENKTKEQATVSKPVKLINGRTVDTKQSAVLPSKPQAQPKSSGGWFSSFTDKLSNVKDNIMNSGAVKNTVGMITTAAGNVAGLFKGNQTEGLKIAGGQTQGVDKTFLDNIAGMSKEFKSIKNRDLVFTSGYREPAKQQALWEAALIKYGSEAAARKWVAPPGKSKHEVGIAADINYAASGKADMDWADSSGLLAKYKLYRPLANEHWHVEPIGSRNGTPPVADGKQNPKIEPKKADVKKIKEKGTSIDPKKNPKAAAISKGEDPKLVGDKLKEKKTSTVTPKKEAKVENKSTVKPTLKTDIAKSKTSTVTPKKETKVENKPSGNVADKEKAKADTVKTNEAKASNEYLAKTSSTSEQTLNVQTEILNALKGMNENIVALNSNISGGLKVNNLDEIQIPGNEAPGVDNKPKTRTVSDIPKPAINLERKKYT